MGSGESIVPQRLIQLANDFDDSVGPLLDQAKIDFAAADIPGEKFSRAGLAMQIAYPGVHDWMVADTAAKRTELRTITDNLALTARIWLGAESDNTITEV